SCTLLENTGTGDTTTHHNDIPLPFIFQHGTQGLSIRAIHKYLSITWLKNIIGISKHSKHRLAQLRKFILANNIGRHDVHKLAKRSHPHASLDKSLLDFRHVDGFRQLNHTNGAQHTYILNMFQLGKLAKV